MKRTNQADQYPKSENKSLAQLECGALDRRNRGLPTVTQFCTETLLNPITQQEKPDAIMKRKRGNEWGVPDR
jgi:hypothetical protein